MADWDYRRPWYHGLQQRLTTLCVGSSITQNRDAARAFSHRPSLLVRPDGGTIKHDGTTPGYLYVVSVKVSIAWLSHSTTPHRYPWRPTT